MTFGAFKKRRLTFGASGKTHGLGPLEFQLWCAQSLGGIQNHAQNMHQGENEVITTLIMKYDKDFVKWVFFCEQCFFSPEERISYRDVKWTCLGQIG